MYLIMVSRAHGVGLKLLLAELAHRQAVPRKDANLNVAHVSTGLRLKHCWMVHDLSLRMSIFAAFSWYAHKLWIILTRIQLLIPAEFMAVLQRRIIGLC